MKHTVLKKSAILLPMLLCLVMILTLSAAAESGRVYDPEGMLTDDEASALEARLDELSAEAGVELYFATYEAEDHDDDFYGDDYCSQVQDIKGRNAILLIVTYDASDTNFYYNMYMYGDAHDKISDLEVDQILDRGEVFTNLKNGLIAEGADAFFAWAVEAYDGHIFDPVGMLTLNEALQLSDLLDELSAEAGVELYFATYEADDRYDDFYGDDYCTRVQNIKGTDAVLLVVTYEYPIDTYFYNMYTYGEANYAINQKEVDYILDTSDVYDNLKGGEIYEGAEVFFAMSAQAFAGRVGAPMALVITISAMIALVIALAVCGAVVAAYKRKKATVDYPLDRYAKLELTHAEDYYVTEHTTRTYSPRSSGGGSRGGGRHGGGGGHRGGR